MPGLPTQDWSWGRGFIWAHLSRGKTPLDLARERGKTEMVQILLNPQARAPQAMFFIVFRAGASWNSSHPFSESTLQWCIGSQDCADSCLLKHRCIAVNLSHQTLPSLRWWTSRLAVQREQTHHWCKFYPILRSASCGFHFPTVFLFVNAVSQPVETCRNQRTNG